MDEDLRAAEIARRMAALAALSRDPETRRALRAEIALFDPRAETLAVLLDLLAAEKDPAVADEARGRLAAVGGAEGLPP